jgi:hypothetical protein
MEECLHANTCYPPAWKIQVWWCTFITPALRRLRQEDGEFKTSLGYIARSCLHKKLIKK